jgi:Cu/Ag efflux protein CusF
MELGLADYPDVKPAREGERKKMRTRMIGTTVGVACLAMGIVGCAASTKEPVQPAAVAPAAPVSGTVGENLVSATAKVKAIDLKTRHVTLQRADGSLVKFVAGDEVRNLPQVKVGDEVNVAYYESLAYEVRKAGEAAPGAAVTEAAARAPLGEKPAGVVGRATTVTATIDAIDKAAPSVTLRAPDGETRTFKVRYPEKLEHVAVGDLVDITYTEAIAISVTTPEK